MADDLMAQLERIERSLDGFFAKYDRMRNVLQAIREDLESGEPHRFRLHYDELVEVLELSPQNGGRV